MEENIDEEIEYNYTPSKFVEAYPVETCVAEYIKIYEEETNNARSCLEASLDIPYGEKRECKIDLYKNSGTNDDANIFVFIHGGYWQMCSKNQFGFMAFPSTHANAITAVVGYQLAPNATMDEIVSQITSSLQFIKKRYKDSKLYLSGHSAGAHLVAMALATTCDLDLLNSISGLLLLSGVYDIRPILKTSNNKPLNMDMATATRNSPSLLFQNQKPMFSCPVVLAYGQLDPPSFKEQSLTFSQVLQNQGMQTRCLEIANTDHFSLISKFIDKDYQLSQEMIKMLKE